MRQNDWGVTPVDVTAVLVLLVLLFTAAIRAGVLLNEEEDRQKCAANLRQIGLGMILYGNENRDQFPRTVYDIEDPQPVWGTPYEADAALGPAPDANPFAAADSPQAQYRPEPNDVTAALFLLLRTQGITSDVFVCPSTLRRGWNFGGNGNTARHWTNWAGTSVLRERLSYSYQNPYFTKEAVSQGSRWTVVLGSDVAVAADMNPGTDAVLKVTIDSPPAAMREANSLNHLREGQNVLYADASVRFHDSPFASVAGDNIYTYGPSDRDHRQSGGTGIVGSSSGGRDSILLPTARDLGLIDEDGESTEEVTRLTEEELEELRQEIIGEYSRTEAGRTIRLRITEDQIIATGGPVTVTYAYEFRNGSGRGESHPRAQWCDR